MSVEVHAAPRVLRVDGKHARAARRDRRATPQLVALSRTRGLPNIHLKLKSPYRSTRPSYNSAASAAPPRPRCRSISAATEERAATAVYRPRHRIILLSAPSSFEFARSQLDLDDAYHRFAPPPMGMGTSNNNECSSMPAAGPVWRRRVLGVGSDRRRRLCPHVPQQIHTPLSSLSRHGYRPPGQFPQRREHPQPSNSSPPRALADQTRTSGNTRKPSNSGAVHPRRVTNLLFALNGRDHIPVLQGERAWISFTIGPPSSYMMQEHQRQRRRARSRRKSLGGLRARPRSSHLTRSDSSYYPGVPRGIIHRNASTRQHPLPGQTCSTRSPITAARSRLQSPPGPNERMPIAPAVTRTTSLLLRAATALSPRSPRAPSPLNRTSMRNISSTMRAWTRATSSPLHLTSTTEAARADGAR
ncbi:hypothetical protein DFH06DRAFT_1329205 [Mycena polygramma]|nr:hypothetical protein DFH06DRAFT_1329205 [Mycena polygramma]